ncbi:MAG: HAD hydrolase family protein [Patescibacteria group bacterium]
MSKLVLLDLDLTLINREYHLTLPLDQVRLIIGAAKGKGAVIGLNSDSSYHTLSGWYELLGLNGPIISERGARIWLPGQADQIEVSSLAANLFPRLKADFIQNLLSAGEQVLVGDANKLQAAYQPHLGQKKIIIINDYRVRSLSFFARRVAEDGKLVIDSELLDKAVALLTSLIHNYPWLEQDKDEDKNPDYGIYILHSLSSQKYQAAAKLLNSLNLDQMWMVGDNLPDFIADPRVKHAAVSNARDQFKARADLITTGAITAGVMEFLQSL